MPFNAQNLSNPGMGGPYYTAGVFGSNPLNAPLYKQQSAFSGQEYEQQKGLQQGDIQGKLQLGQQSGDIEKALESMKEGSALKLGQQSGDIQKALENMKETFGASQHQLDIGQAQWLEKAQESAAQNLQSGKISADEFMQQQDLANKLQTANIGNIPALAKLGFGEQVFGQVFPFVQQMLQQGANGGFGFGGAGGGGFGAALGATGGTGSAGSGINPAAQAPGQVWTPQQTQQQINASRAQNDSQTKAGQAQNAARLGGQGFGANSPLLAALNNQLAGQNMQTNSANALNTGLQASQMNAQQATQAAQIAAGLQQAGMNNQASLANARTAANASMYGANLGAQNARFSALMSALSGII